MKKTEEKPEEENCLVWALDHLYKTWPELREEIKRVAEERRREQETKAA